MTRALILLAAAGLLFTACDREAAPADDGPPAHGVVQKPAAKPPAPAEPPAPDKSPATNEPESEAAPGIAVGAKAPAFTLKDQSGKERSLAELLKQGKVALVFYRSADW